MSLHKYKIKGIKSRLSDHVLQPEELQELGNYILLFEALEGKKPTKKEIQDWWVDRGGIIE